MPQSIRTVINVCPLFSPCVSCAEYDRHLAHGKGMATAYLDPNLNHALAGGAKSRLSTGTERAPGAPDRVLKVFHHFESNNEHSTWSSNIRHGDATDVRVREHPNRWRDKNLNMRETLKIFNTVPKP